MLTFTQQVHKDRVSITSTPTTPDAGWEDSNAYRVTLRRKGRQVTTKFHMGLALCREPEAAEVLHCLLSDALSWENTSGLADFMEEFGYDEDSKAQARRVYQGCERESRKMHRFLGEDFSTYAFDTVWDV